MEKTNERKLKKQKLITILLIVTLFCSLILLAFLSSDTLSFFSDKSNNVTNIFSQTDFTLKTGSELNTLIGTDTRKVIFGKYSDYSSAVSSATPTPVDTAGTGAYSLYKIGTEVYILTNYGDTFIANPDSSRFFYNLQSLASIENLTMLDTSNVTDMSYMFYYCQTLTSLDVSGFDTSNVTDIAGMFSFCKALTSLDLSGFNTSKVTNMFAMFRNCEAITSLDLSSFDTSKVTNMSNIFAYCQTLTSLDLSSFNTSNVTDMSLMFWYCVALTSLDLSSFDTTNVTDMSMMFEYCSNLKTIYASNSFNTDKVTSSSSMFLNCSKLVGGAGTTYKSSYLNKTYARIDGGTSSPGYFTAIYILKTGSEMKSLIGTDTTKVIFGKYSDYSSAVSSATPTPVDTEETGAYSLYKVGTVAYILTKSGDTFIANPDSSRFFYNLQKLTSIENLTMLDTSKVTDMSYMFAYCKALTSLNVSGFNTSNVTNMYWMFAVCSNLTSLDVSGFDTSNVTDMSYMFSRCSNLTSLDVSGFDTSKVTDMGYMFSTCTALTSLDVSGFDTSKVTDMSYMFSNCTNLKTIYASESFNTNKVTGSNSMFLNCSKLVGGAGTIYKSSYTDKTYARIDGGTSSPGYFTLKE